MTEHIIPTSDASQNNAAGVVEVVETGSTKVNPLGLSEAKLIVFFETL